MAKTCVICERPYDGHGHNALPLADGRCCDPCNGLVIAYRVDLIQRELASWRAAEAAQKRDASD